MNRQPKDKTTKTGAGTEEVDLNTASPTGHEEVESAIAAEVKGDAEVPRPVDPSDRKEHKPLEPDQPRNPRRQTNSRPD
jgi:hypothetical protein